ncbi:unnamed protein product [Nyctereutes procyonoides]|uniref:(raccoon dog) hypothetical protein n=1 Tax=Nyctereutes procyonoides TaxID=34880 RepID=A0A811XXS9_NYCPR|nr:unnamed protein product [Nyctereutes procyonoides]
MGHTGRVCPGTSRDLAGEGAPSPARPPPVCGARPMRSDRGRSFVVEPRPPGASRPRPCPPPSSPGRLARRPPGPLKETRTLSPGDPPPQRRLFPGKGSRVDPDGGGAEQEPGASRRRSQAS